MRRASPTSRPSSARPTRRGKKSRSCSSRRSTSSSARDGSSAASPSRTPSPKIEIDGFTYSVTELLAIKSEARSVSYGGRRTAAETNPARDQSCCVYECLNDGNGKSLLAQYNRGNDKDGVSVVLYYDEAKKKARYDKWYDFVTKITSELEIFNARTKLMDPEDYTLTPKEKTE